MEVNDFFVPLKVSCREAPGDEANVLVEASASDTTSPRRPDLGGIWSRDPG